MADTATPQAGRELNAEVCEVVFGLEVRPYGVRGYLVKGWHRGEPGLETTPPPFSADTAPGWGAMRSLLLRMQELGWHARLTTPFAYQDGYRAGFTPLNTTGRNGRPDHQAGADSLPLAVALAALLAVRAGINGPLPPEVEP